MEVEFYLIFPLLWWSFRRWPWLTAAAMIAIAGVWRAELEQCCFATLFAQWSENLPGYLDLFAFGMLCAYVYVRFGGTLRARVGYAGPIVTIAGVVLLGGTLGESLRVRQARSLVDGMASRPATAHRRVVSARRAGRAGEAIRN